MSCGVIGRNIMNYVGGGIRVQRTFPHVSSISNTGLRGLVWLLQTDLPGLGDDNKKGFTRL